MKIKLFNPLFDSKNTYEETAAVVSPSPRIGDLVEVIIPAKSGDLKGLYSQSYNVVYPLMADAELEQEIPDTFIGKK